MDNAVVVPNLEDWVNYLKAKGNSNNTVYAYQADMTLFYRWLAEATHSDIATFEFDWRNVTTGVVRKYVRFLLAKNLLPASVSRKISVIKSFYKYLIRQKVAQVDPTENTYNYKVSSGQKVSVVTRADTQRLARAIQRKIKKRKPNTRSWCLARRNALILRLLVGTGIRISELVNLSLEDIDLATDYVRVRARLERQVPVDAKTHALLVDYIDNVRPHFVKSSCVKVLIPNQHGEVFTRQGVTLVFKTYLGDAKLSGKFNFRALRNAVAKQLFDAETDVEDAQKILGLVKTETARRLQKNLKAR